MVNFDPLIDHTFLRTPPVITPTVRSFCQSITQGTELIYLPVTPEPGCEAGECYFNVQKVVSELGGSGVFGWLIWEWPYAFIEAEHHMVIEKEQKFIDITPDSSGFSKILFLRDDSTKFNYDTKKSIHNIQSPLIRHKTVINYINSINYFKSLFGDVAGEEVKVLELEVNKRRLNSTIAKNNMILHLRRAAGRNEPCLCGSGVKYKKCCYI